MGSFVNRLVPLVAIVLAVAVHFHYCEWAYSSNARSVPSEQMQRAIYFRHQTGSNVFLLAKSTEDKERATRYGVYLPATIAAISLASLKLS